MKALFCIGMMLFSLPALALEIPLRNNQGQQSGTLYLPMKAALKSVPLGLRICADQVIQSVVFLPKPESRGNLLAEDGCLIANFLLLQSDTLVTATTDRGEQIQGVLAVSNGFQDSGFILLRTDRERFVSMHIQPDDRSAIICSNRSLELLQVEGRVHESRDPFLDLATISRDSDTCFLLTDFSILSSSETWEIFFHYADGERVRLVEQFSQEP